MEWGRKEDCLGPYPIETYCLVEEMKKHNLNKKVNNKITYCDKKNEISNQEVKVELKGGLLGFGGGEEVTSRLRPEDEKKPAVQGM